MQYTHYTLYKRRLDSKNDLERKCKNAKEKRKKKNSHHKYSKNEF